MIDVASVRARVLTRWPAGVTLLVRISVTPGAAATLGLRRTASKRFL